MFFKDEALPETTVCGVPEDDLYECANCRMVVHGQCYSAKALYRGGSCLHSRELLLSLSDQPDPEVAGPSRESREWLCERCRDHDDVTVRMATCHLCELRGGALLKVVTSAGERYFVHVVCALMHRRTKFVTAHSRASPFTYPTALLGQAATAMLSEKWVGCGVWGYWWGPNDTATADSRPVLDLSRRRHALSKTNVSGIA